MHNLPLFSFQKIDHRISACDMQVSAFEGGLYFFFFARIWFLKRQFLSQSQAKQIIWDAVESQGLWSAKHGLY